MADNVCDGFLRSPEADQSGALIKRREWSNLRHLDLQRAQRFDIARVPLKDSQQRELVQRGWMKVAGKFSGMRDTSFNQGSEFIGGDAPFFGEHYLGLQMP